MSHTESEMSNGASVVDTLTDEARNCLKALLSMEKYSSRGAVISEAIVALHNRESPPALFQGRFACGLHFV